MPDVIDTIRHRDRFHISRERTIDVRVNCNDERERFNQLIVGPRSLDPTLLHETYGERFLCDPKSMNLFKLSSLLRSDTISIYVD